MVSMYASLSRYVILGGIRVDIMSRRNWAEKIIQKCVSPRTEQSKPSVTFAANGQVLAMFASSETFRRDFEHADTVCADGQPLVWASRFTSSPLPERVATTDLFHNVASEAEKAGLSFYLLGASEKNNAFAEKRINEWYPNITIVGRRNGYFNFADEDSIVREIQEAKPDILWIGLGVPLQEAFVARNISKLGGIGWVMTCGGLFDHFTDEVSRAPQWMQRLALEWLFRTWQHPQKYLVRYLTTNPIALWLLLTRTKST